jgi:hypothetical protein
MLDTSQACVNTLRVGIPISNFTCAFTEVVPQVLGFNISPMNENHSPNQPKTFHKVSDVSSLLEAVMLALEYLFEVADGLHQPFSLLE